MKELSFEKMEIVNGGIEGYYANCGDDGLYFNTNYWWAVLASLLGCEVSNGVYWED